MAEPTQHAHTDAHALKPGAGAHENAQPTQQPKEAPVDPLTAYLAAFDTHARQQSNKTTEPPGAGIVAVLDLVAGQFAGWPRMPDDSVKAARDQWEAQQSQKNASADASAAQASAGGGTKPLPSTPSPASSHSAR